MLVVLGGKGRVILESIAKMTYSIAYALFQPRFAWIYTAVSVCMQKLIKLTTKKNDA